MIHQIYSSIETFKAIEFRPGLNLVLAQKSVGATPGQTRNRAGKTSFVEMIHFLTGAKVDPKTPFSSPDLKNKTFGMDLDIGRQRVSVERKNTLGAKPVVDGTAIASTEWRSQLGSAFFDLPANNSDDDKGPSFRSLFPYFARRQASLGFTSPEKQAFKSSHGDWQMALMYFLGLDWRLAREWQVVRGRESTLKELKKAASDGALGAAIGTAADLRTKHTLADARLAKLKTELEVFHVLPEYRSLEKEADQIQARLAKLSNDNSIDLAAIRHAETALHSESPPSPVDLEQLYQEAGVILPPTIMRRYEEVREFHASVLRNRHDYLLEEAQSAQNRITHREPELQNLNHRQQEVMGMLKGHGALDQFSKMQAEVARLEVQVESLLQRFQAAEQLEGTKTELELERGRLRLRLRRDFSEQNDRVRSAILAYEEFSKALYEEAGSMTIYETANGPSPKFPIQGERSKGIGNMKIFCYDLMLMKLCAERGIGPGFLIHDSHLFDGVDGRQIVSALRVGAEAAKTYGFQYIVTLNEDDAFKEKEPGFSVEDYVLPVRLTDATENGGLFGFRFD
jgi:uncharacterized protein YydD (DUF2326 family)